MPMPSDEPVTRRMPSARARADFCADGAVFRDDCGVDFGESRFERVGVDDCAADERARAVGDVGEARGEQAAGAAFGSGERKLAHLEREQDDFFKRFAVGGEDVFTHLVLDQVR